MEELKEMLYCELDELTKGGKLSTGSLEAIGEILDALKDISKIEAMEMGYSGEYSNEGGSMRGSYAREGNSMRGGYYRDGSYEGSYEGGSYARRRNRMGQFSRYSREGESDQLEEKLEKLMDETTNGGDRQKLRQSVMEIMEKYK